MNYLYVLFFALCIELTQPGGLQDRPSGRPQYTPPGGPQYGLSGRYQHLQPGGPQDGLPGASDDDNAIYWIIGDGFIVLFWILLTMIFDNNYFIALVCFIKFVASKPITYLDDDLPIDSDYEIMYWMTMFVIILALLTIMLAVVAHLARSSINNDLDDDSCDYDCDYDYVNYIL